MDEQGAQCRSGFAEYQLAQQHGFNNITIDLIYGTPTLTDEKWQKNVEKAFALNVPHLSCYALTVEPKTALEKMIAANKIAAVDPEKQGRQFELLMDWVSNLGYEHYEISNFAKPGFRSKHNSSYWQGKPYVDWGRPHIHSWQQPAMEYCQQCFIREKYRAGRGTFLKQKH